MPIIEKLGSFFLGKEYDLKTKKLLDAPVNYDSRDLVTHALCVGMTGSGKTGLCIDLLEEAALDGVPAILIDPKGDITNLLLTFPDLRPEDFLPWVNPDDAQRKGLSVEDFAAKTAGDWRTGLASWEEGPDRIKALKNAADFAIYTPGSEAGLPVNILASFKVPTLDWDTESETLRDQIQGTVSALLGLVGVEADPVRSREHILLSSILENAWRAGEDLDIPKLIMAVQKPPFRQVGVFDVETFFPEKDRFGLAMTLNNIIASPSFGAWMTGEPLDIGAMLHSATGKPRHNIFYIAHLSDPERMFFVTILLEQIISWMRAQPGTTSLRAIVYMDEIFGYFPPTANPPSKRPMLTLMKQARAFGVGMMLTTQNPVDLDYKGLTNAGTWFIGKLQAERDKARLMDGLESALAEAGSATDTAVLDKMISSLDSRVFLMHNVNLKAPVVFQTRWAMSYLRGPLTRQQIKTLMAPVKAARQTVPAPVAAPRRVAAAAPVAPITEDAVAAPTPSRAAAPTANLQSTLPPDIQQFFLPARGRGGAGQSLTYQPNLVGAAKVRFADAKTKTEVSQTLAYVTEITDGAVAVNWEVAQEAGFELGDLVKSPVAGAQFAPLPGGASSAKNYTTWSRDFVNWVYGAQKLSLYRSPTTGKFSNPGESERDFRVRLQQAFREQRDEAVQALRQKYAAKVASLQEKIRHAQDAVDREASQASAAKVQTAISFGSTILSAFLGKGRSSVGTIGKAATAARGVGRSMQQSQDVGRAKEDMETYQQQLKDLEAQLNDEITALQAKMDPQNETLDSLTIRPKKTDIAVQLVTLLWLPYWQDARGNVSQAW
ncbi:MAG: ATP-binding protein [Chloroflexi bacterium]|nr:ATP-binding protein [Chloroflexota bacterium]